VGSVTEIDLAVVFAEVGFVPVADWVCFLSEQDWQTLN
jgi:hypothetical protein